MGRTLKNKQAIVSALQSQLDETKMAVVIDYRGLSVAEITDLRNRIRPSGASCKVTKNTLMRKAIEGNEDWQNLSEFLTDSSAFLLLKDDFGSAIKAYQSFQKETKKSVLRGGVLDGAVLSETDVKAIGDLPSKEDLMAQIAGALNAVTAKVAIGIKEVPSSIARGLQAYVDKGE
ncbi:MAG: 50S ribosomal protein L10 [Thermosynechococcaceae cyanobacterium]